MRLESCGSFSSLLAIANPLILSPISQAQSLVHSFTSPSTYQYKSNSIHTVIQLPQLSTGTPVASITRSLLDSTMARSLALLAFSSAVLAAQTTTVKLLLPFADPQPLVASVVAADSSATTYAVGCPPGTDSDECGFAESQTITQGPSTYAFTMAYSGDEGS